MADRLVLVPDLDVAPEDIMAALDDLGARKQSSPAEGDLVTWTLDGATVHLFEDAGLHIELFLVDGDGAPAAAQRLRDRLAIYTPEDMPELFASMHDPNSQTAFNLRLAILAAVAPPQADPALVELFRRGFEHPDYLVRRRAALYASVPKWPELRPMVERLANDDDEPKVRETAAASLRDFDA